MTTSGVMPPGVQIVRGKQIYINGNHHPCRETGTVWYRHDRVLLDGREIGRIQIKERVARFGRFRQRRTETTTHTSDAAVLGYQLDWLLNRAG